MRVVVVVLRVLAIACLLGFLAQFRLSGKSAPRRETLNVLIDHSKSMEDDSQQLSRVIETVARWAKTRNWQARLFGFDKKLKEAKTLKEILSSPYGPRTALGSAISELENVLEKNSGVLVLSDGVETENREKIPETHLGVFAIAFGGEPLDDIVLSEVVIPAALFARGNAPFKLEIRYPRGLRDAFLLSIRDLKTRGTVFLTTVTLSGFSPQLLELNVPVGRLTGKKRWEFAIEPRDWETDKTNNKRVVDVNIRREKLRVLYIAGKPSLDYSYLRDFIRSQRERELVSFVILRNPEDVPPFGETELSLIPFPAQDLFLKNLGEFDLFILHDFSFTRFGLPPLYMTKIMDFIRQGGGFILMSGSQTTGSEYKGIFEEVFGVTAPPAYRSEGPIFDWQSGGGVKTLREGKFEFSISNAKSWNRIFSYYSPTEQNLAFWKQALVGLSAFQELSIIPPAKVGGAKSPHLPEVGGEVLATAQIEETSFPLLVTSSLGKGRACLQSFVGSWLWKTKNGVLGSGDAYDFYWESLFDWVTQEEKSLAVSQVKESPLLKEDPETRLSIDYDYLQRLNSLNRGALLGAASDWMKEVSPRHEEKILRFFEERAPLGDDAKKPWSFAFNEKALLAAVLLLVLEWLLRRFWIGENF